MRTRQFKRLGSLLINQPFGENLLPEAGLSRKKQKNTNQRRPSNASIYPKLQKLNVFDVDMPVDETLYSIDQINLEVKSAQARKLSEFGYQLQQRKKFRWFYGGLSTKHVRKLLTTMHDDASVFQALERRLDVALYRCGFFSSIYMARQWILHKRILVNGKRAGRPSYALCPGDVLQVDTPWHTLLGQSMFDRFTRFFKQSTQISATYPNVYSSTASAFGLDARLQAMKGAKDTTTPADLETRFGAFKDAPSAAKYIKTVADTTLFHPVSVMKPVHFEISFSTFTAVYLYAPQRIVFPTLLDVPAIRRSL